MLLRLGFKKTNLGFALTKNHSDNGVCLKYKAVISGLNEENMYRVSVP